MTVFTRTYIGWYKWYDAMVLVRVCVRECAHVFVSDTRACVRVFVCECFYFVLDAYTFQPIVTAIQSKKFDRSFDLHVPQIHWKILK